MRSGETTEGPATELLRATETTEEDLEMPDTEVAEGWGAGAPLAGAAYVWKFAQEIAKAIESSPDEKAVEAVQKRLEDSLGTAPEVPGDLQQAMELVKHLPKIAPLEADQDIAEASAEDAFRVARAKARLKLVSEQSAWELAHATFKAESQEAGEVLKSEVAAAQDAYSKAEAEGPSPSALQRLHYERAAAVGAALTSYEKSTAKSADALAAAFGSLMAAYVTFWGKVSTAEAQRRTATSSSEQERWSEVDTVLSK